MSTRGQRTTTTAQNIFTYAGRYRVAETLTRESILLSTIWQYRCWS